MNKTQGVFRGSLRPQALALLVIGLIVGALGIFQASPAAADPAKLAVNPSNSVATVSTNFTTQIQVTLQSGESINAADIVINYDTSLIEFVSYSNGSALPNDISPNTPNICNNTTGACVYRAFRTGSSISGPGTFTLFSITWHALAPGTNSNAIDIQSSSSTGGPVLANAGNPVAVNSITDGAVTVQPQPAELTATKTDTVDPVDTNGVTTYNITISNAGPAAANGYFVEDTVPAGVIVESYTASDGAACATDPGGDTTPPWTGPVVIRCGPFNTPASGSDTISFDVTITASGPGSVTNVVTADPDNDIPEGNNANNTAQQVTTVNPPPPPPPPPSLFVDPASQTRSISNIFATEIEVANIPNFSGADIQISFNRSVIEFVSYTNGTILPNDSLSASPLCNNATGACRYIATRTGTPPASTTGVLFTITWHALQPGVSPIDITTAILSDNNGQPITGVTVTDGSVTVVQAAITGTVHLIDTGTAWAPPPCPGAMPAALCQTTVTADSASQTLPTGEGNFNLPVGPGAFDVTISHPLFLDRFICNVNVTTADVNIGSFTLRGGDVVGTGEAANQDSINIFDLSAIAADIGMPYDPNSDINGDGVVSILDLSIAAANFNQTTTHC